MRATQLPRGALLPRADWRSRGVSSQRLAGPSLTTVFRGFSTPTAAPATLNTMCHVLQNDVLPGAVISHTTAAALLGIAVPWWVDRELGVLAAAAYRSDGVRIIPSTLPHPPQKNGDTSSDGLSDAWRARVESGLPLDRHGIRSGPPAASRPLVEPPLMHCRLEPGPPRSVGPHATVHRTSSRASFSFHGLDLSHPYVVLLELATMLDHDDIVIAVDSLVSRKPPLNGASLEKIRSSVDSFDRLWGVTALRRALEDARPNTDSPGETRTRLLLTRAGFPEPVINLPVRDPDAATTRYLDLAYPELKIAVEYDGDYHRVSREQWLLDTARRDSLRSMGWNLRVLTGLDIKRPRRALDALHRSFVEAGARAPSPSNWTGRGERRLRRSLRPPTA